MTQLTVHISQAEENQLRLLATARGHSPEAIAAAILGAALRTEPVLRVYTCPVCKRHDAYGYLTCQRPDCTDGRDPR